MDVTFPEFRDDPDFAPHAPETPVPNDNEPE